MQRICIKIKKFHVLPLTIILLGAILSFACENDLKDIDRIANIKKEEAVDISKHVTVIYSDSARVKAELTAPEMRVYHDTTNRNQGDYEFKKGVKIIFFDEEAKENQRITSNYAKQYAKTGIIEFRNNVVLIMENGSIVKTEELFYDEKNSKYYNTQPISIEFTDGRGHMQGTSFTSDSNFNDVEFQGSTGLYYLNSNQQLPGFGN
ncbi:LPS export ABC transporter periplasmic protein LptC [Sphingobacterium sp. DK4209]|uniref:LPS export ABC transporter periplasmic protein LptC n=1 Tax=Sphingobacterium zhuxiongii TaxID=2662364 RepID=A0A5Q0Q7S5_9SPHI|nr:MULTISPECIES: LPS export ABC transporter periplasmic protein LptC [unclassified Sphingobacterium]MVZ64822.1 LPS export ABC transporter periplasmic protein LptC [Sphingobacterium sp. DK4209]QGA25169.1 LPS export ABC transporter periplasmic protein LptC [Sphingobacterium sp. dk4302]